MCPMTNYHPGDSGNFVGKTGKREMQKCNEFRNQYPVFHTLYRYYAKLRLQERLTHIFMVLDAILIRWKVKKIVLKRTLQNI